MITSAKELAAELNQVNVAAVSRLSGLCVRTIYRLRHQKHSPSLDTVAKLMPAIAQCKKEASCKT